MDKELTNKEKIDFLKRDISYSIYCQIIECKLSEDQLCQIYDEITDECCSWDERKFMIVDKPSGDFQDCQDGLKVWVNQRRFGEAEDSWVGEIYVEIAKDKYLTWGFYC